MAGQVSRPTDLRLYAVYAQTDPNNPPIFRESSDTLTTALESLRAERQQAPDQGSFIVPTNATERDEFPYRNRIGPVPDKDSKHWGYRFRVPGTSDVLVMYVEKRQLDQSGEPPKPSLKEELEAEGMAEEVQKLEVDYVVYNHAQIAADQAAGRRYDESKRDFVFDDE